MRGWSIYPHAFKRDLDNFFGNVPRKLVWEALDWMVDAFMSHDKGGWRKKFVCIPKKATSRLAYKEKGVCYTRAFHYHLRNQARDRPCLRFQNSKVTTECYTTFNVFDFREVIKCEFDTGYLWYGESLFATIEGCTQGSVLSPGLCLMTCAYIEKVVVNMAFKGKNWTVSHLIKRWMDDIMTFINVNYCKGVTEEDAMAIANDCEEKVCAVYKEKFDIKVEDASEFVGINLFFDNHRLLASPASAFSFDTKETIKFKVLRFQNWFSPVDNVAKLCIVQGLIFQTIDRCNDTELMIRSVCKVILEFVAVDYPFLGIKSVLKKVQGQHRYLTSELELAFRAAKNIWFIFCRVGQKNIPAFCRPDHGLQFS